LEIKDFQIFSTFLLVLSTNSLQFDAFFLNRKQVLISSLMFLLQEMNLDFSVFRCLCWKTGFVHATGCLLPVCVCVPQDLVRVGSVTQTPVSSSPAARTPLMTG